MKHSPLQTKHSTPLKPSNNRPMQVSNVSLWSMDVPYLYRLETSLVRTHGSVNTQVDNHTTMVGVRKIRWLVLRLNNQPVKLRGVANHQDLGGVGTAVPDALQMYRVHTMKAIGANFWRCAHNPPNLALVSAADRLGMAVMVENRRFGPGDNYDSHNTAPPLTRVEIAQDITAMVRAHRNSPSVFMWSLCNEEGCFEHPDTSAAGGLVGKHVLFVMSCCVVLLLVVLCCVVSSGVVLCCVVLCILYFLFVVI